MSIRLGSLHKILVYGVTIALALTGVLWLVPHFFLASKGDFGASHHPLEPWALRLHGAAAMGFLVGLGSVLPVHARRAWQVRRNVRTGVSMLAAIVALIATGYALYYASSEELRPWISTIHWGIGLALVPALFLHNHQGRKAVAPSTYPLSRDRRSHRQTAEESRTTMPRARRGARV
jgi:hypothetical protein